MDTLSQVHGEVVVVTGIIHKEVPLPVEPLYDLKFAAQLIPCTPKGLTTLLNRNKPLYPPRYRRDSTGRRIRLLTPQEIKQVRRSMVRGDVESTINPTP